MFVDCKKRVSTSIREAQPLQQLKKKSNDLFLLPAINGSCNKMMFAKYTTIKPIETDWSIIEDAFKPVDHDNPKHNNATNINESHLSAEAEILQTENESQYGVQSSINVNEPISHAPSKSSTPLRTFSRQNIRCSTPVPVSSNENTRHNIITPPSDLHQWNSASDMSLSHLLVPPIDFNDEIQSNFEQQTTSDPSPFQQNISHNVTENDQNNTKLFDCPDLLTSLGEHSLEHVIISKLIALWQKKMHPIQVENLLPSHSNRIKAAKTFASLLSG